MYELSPIGRQEYIDGEKCYCILRLDAILTDDRSNGRICEIGLQLRIIRVYDTVIYSLITNNTGMSS